MRITCVNKCDSSELFSFAEREYDISWNACNDLFFDNILQYKSVDYFEIDTLLEYFYQEKDDNDDFDIRTVRKMSADNINALDNEVKAAAIIIKFMLFHNIKRIQIDNR